MWVYEYFLRSRASAEIGWESISFDEYTNCNVQKCEVL